MTFAITLECLSAPTVQHHLTHNALRFEQDFINDLGCYSDEVSTKVCLATLASDPRVVVGMVIFRANEYSLYFGFIRVSRDFQRLGLAKRMVTYVIQYPLNMCIGRVWWTAGSDGGEALIRHLEWLQCNANRLCGTPFELEATPQNKKLS